MELFFIPAPGGIPFGIDANTFWKNSGRIPLGAGATFSVPGPATGFLRVFSTLVQTSDVPANTILTDGVLQPSALRIWRGQGSATFSLQPSSAPLVLKNGESIDITNTSAFAGHLFFVYADVRDPGNYTAVRTTVTGAAITTLIPAPPPGFQRKWVNFFTNVSTFTTVDRPNAVASNDDTIAHVLEAFFGANALSRGASLPAGTISGTPFLGAGNSDLCVTAADGDFGVESTTAIVTNPIVFTGMYQTLPIGP